MEYTVSKEHSGSYISIELVERLLDYSEPVNIVCMIYGPKSTDFYHHRSQHFQSHEEAVDYLDALIDWAQQCKAALIAADGGEAVPASVPDAPPAPVDEDDELAERFEAWYDAASDDDDTMTCPKCDGVGMVAVSNEFGNDDEADCPRCGGFGWLDTGSDDDDDDDDAIDIDDTAELPSARVTLAGRSLWLAQARWEVRAASYASAVAVLEAV